MGRNVEQPDIEAEVRAFLVDEVLGAESAGLAEDVPLLSGLLDSLGLMELLEFLEERYAIKMDADDVVDENFTSLRSLAAFVESKRPGTVRS
ncbi:MAG: acyl carrier protein [Actinobacteria bacterium]|nr:acyl carrier protein [Actinomycetota bacterium]